MAIKMPVRQLSLTGILFYKIITLAALKKVLHIMMFIATVKTLASDFLIDFNYNKYEFELKKRLKIKFLGSQQLHDRFK